MPTRAAAIKLKWLSMKHEGQIANGRSQLALTWVHRLNNDGAVNGERRGAYANIRRAAAAIHM
eukprot:scaffold205716_cov48-Prasinocladus_malaysianus.AAC.1